MLARFNGFLIAGISLFTGSALAAPLATYTFSGSENNFTNTTTNGGNHPAFAPTTASGLTATSIAATGGGTTSGVRVGNDNLTYVDQGEVLVIGTAGTNAFADTDYFSITLTPGNGNSLNLENITVQAARGGGSARGFRVKSSVDGFTAVLSGAETEALATARPTFTAYTINLGTAPFDAINAAVEFRFYVYSSAAGNTVEMDNLTVSGEVVPVPEPGSLAILGLGTLAMFRRRAMHSR